MPSEREITTGETVFSAVHSISALTPFADFLTWEKKLRELDSVSSTRRQDKLIIYVSIADEYTDAPPGSHELAKGFILFGRLLQIQAILQQQLSWLHGSWSAGSFKPSTDSNSRFIISPEGQFTTLGPIKED